MKLTLSTNVIATVFNEHGNVIDRREGKNTVAEGDPNSVHNGLVWLLENMCRADIYYDSQYYVNRVQLGTGTPSTSGLGTPIVATLKNIDTKAFDESGGSWYNDPTIVLTTSWGASYGALSGITEAAIFTDEVTTPDMFSYKTFTPALAKTAGGTLQLTWEVKIAYT